ncbi:VTT domain-containing protein [Tunturiibacter lichenicola]|uniref:VTT domain-containing protein n=1 Tax=Tunturiibacter lichenicola TaxID=2051959 RepID=UPI003D9AFB74
MNYYLTHITYPILFVAVFARQLSLPVPALLFLLTGGALAGSGKLSFVGILLVAVLGCVLADLLWYEAGRLRGKRVLRLLCALTRDPSFCMRRGKEIFAKKGLRLLLIAKFVPGLDGICPPLAGMLGASRPAFLVYDAGGASFWAAAYIGCGFLFARQLDHVAQRISAVATVVVLVFGVPLLIMFVLKLTQLVMMIRLLRPLQIDPGMLKSRLDLGEKVGVLDLLRFEEDPEGVGVIPGAVRLDPLEIRRKKRIVIPSDVNLVLYCRSRNSFVSARVALAMRKHGIQNIYVLKGGLEAWKGLGFPLTEQFADMEAEIARLGIEVTPPWNHIPLRT